MEKAVFLVMVLFPAAAVSFAWAKWCAAHFAVEAPHWRGRLAILGLLATTAQVLLLVAFWLWNIRIGGWSHDPEVFRIWFFTELFLSMLVALCALVGKSSFRWWMLSASLVLFLNSLFEALSA